MEETEEVSIEADVTEHPRDDKSRPYLCTMCNKRFTLRGNLNVHKRIHTEEKPFVCTVCDKRFTHGGSLSHHKRIHTGEKPFVCTVCDKRFTWKGTLKVHKRIHTVEKPFTCTVCDKRFTQKEDLKLHRQTHAGEKPFVCTVCNKRFTQRGSFDHHKRSHCGQKSCVSALCGNTFERPQQPLSHRRAHKEETTSYKCSLCHLCFSNNSILQLHERHVHNGVLHADRKREMSQENHGSTSVTTVLMNAIMPAIRPVMGTTTAVTSQVQAIRRKPPLQSHIVRLHSSTTTTVLSQTPVLSTPTSGTLTEKPLECTVCGKGFRTSRDLAVHGRTHSAEKPYKCHVCGATFADPVNLISHTTVHTWYSKSLSIAGGLQLPKRVVDENGDGKVTRENRGNAAGTTVVMITVIPTVRPQTGSVPAVMDEDETMSLSAQL